MSSSSSSSSSSPPPTIGPYTISREIGKGSFAVVHRGHYKDGPEARRRPVAIKIVTRRKLTQKLLDNLEGEIAILKTVSHPNIVELIDCLKTDSHIYLVMHFSAGGDLSQYIRRKGVLANLDDQAADPSSSLSMSRSFIEATKRYPHPTDGGLHDSVVRSFLEQLASAMQFMRARNIVHRDIKPQNLLLQPPDPACLTTGHPPGIPQMKVADFGFARSLPAASLAETLCGSPLYMAPEILRYEKYDAKADLWSIGAVTYEMVVGKPPFRASNHVELLRRIERNDDRIRFPDERSEATWLREVEKRRESGEVVGVEEERRGPTKVKEDLKALVRGLLKRVPVERMSFEEFFGSPVILGARPAGAAKMVGSETTETVVAAGEAAVAAKPVSPPRPTPGPALPLQPPSSTRVQAPPPLPPMPPLPKFPPKYIVSRGEASSSSATGKAARSTTTSTTTATEGGTVTSPRPPSPSSPTPSPTPSQVAITPATPTTPSSTTATAGTSAPPQEDSDSDSQYVLIDKGSLDTQQAALAEELSRSPSTTGSAPSRSPLSAQAQGAVSAAARLARRPSRLTKLSSGFSAAVGVGGTTGREAVAPTSSGGGGGGGGLSPTSPRSATATLTPSSPRPALTPLPVAGGGTPSPSPAPSTSPSAPFALPPGVRRQSFASRRVSSSSSGSGSFGAAAPAVEQEKQLQQQATTYPATSHQPQAQQTQAAPQPSSALARALSQASQASQKLFGIPSGMSLLGALALLRGGASSISSIPASSASAALTTSAAAGGGGGGATPGSASLPGGGEDDNDVESEEKEAQLLLRLDDLGQKAYVLCEFADAKMCAVFGDSWSTGTSTGSGIMGAAGGQGVGSISGSTSSSLLAEGPSMVTGVAQRYQQRSPSFGGVGASPPQYASSHAHSHSLSSTIDDHQHHHLTQITSESLQIYIKSLSFLQAGIEAVRAHLAASATRRAATGTGTRGNAGVGVVAVEINEAVQYLRRRFAETMEKAEAVRTRMRTIPTSPRHTGTGTGAAVVAGAGVGVVNVEKVIYDKAMELARAAAVDELENQSSSSPAGTAVEIRPGTSPPGAIATTAASGSGGGTGGWDMQACLLAYETAEIMLSTLIDDHPGGGSGGVGGAALTVQPFIKSISHRCQILRGRVADARVGGG